MSNYTFTVKATDVNGKTGTRQYTLAVLNTANDPLFTFESSAIVSNNQFFIEYEEDIVGTQTFTFDSTTLKSNNQFFIEYEEDIVGTPTFTFDSTTLKSNIEFFTKYEEDLAPNLLFEFPGTDVVSLAAA